MRSSGRHFLPISHVKKTVVAASMAKLNVIHWHLVDSTSFATCSDTYPPVGRSTPSISIQSVFFVGISDMTGFYQM